MIITTTTIIIIIIIIISSVITNDLFVSTTLYFNNIHVQLQVLYINYYTPQNLC